MHSMNNHSLIIPNIFVNIKNFDECGTLESSKLLSFAYKVTDFHAVAALFVENIGTILMSFLIARSSRSLLRNGMIC